LADQQKIAPGIHHVRIGALTLAEIIVMPDHTHCSRLDASAIMGEDVT